MLSGFININLFHKYTIFYQENNKYPETEKIELLTEIRDEIGDWVQDFHYYMNGESNTLTITDCCELIGAEDDSCCDLNGVDDGSCCDSGETNGDCCSPSDSTQNKESG